MKLPFIIFLLLIIKLRFIEGTEFKVKIPNTLIKYPELEYLFVGGAKKAMQLTVYQVKNPKEDKPSVSLAIEEEQIIAEEHKGKDVLPYKGTATPTHKGKVYSTDKGKGIATDEVTVPRAILSYKFLIPNHWDQHELELRIKLAKSGQVSNIPTYLFNRS